MTKPRRLKHRFPWSELSENMLRICVFGRSCRWTVSGICFQCSSLCSSLSSLLSEFQPLTYGQVITETSHSFRNDNIIRESPSSAPCQQGKTPKLYYLSFLLLQKCRHKVAAHACHGTSQQLRPDGWLTVCAPGCVATLQYKFISLPAEMIEIERKKQTLQEKDQRSRMGREALEAASIRLLKSVVLDWCCSRSSQSFSSGEGLQLPLSVSGWLWTP